MGSERRPKRKRPALYLFCEQPKLQTAWDGLRKNPLSYGIDSISIDQFKGTLQSALSKIRSDILSKDYRFQKLRGIPIPKPGSQKIRPIQVPAVRDRVVAKALALYIEPDLRPFDHPFSFGYRAGLSRNHAIKEIHAAAASGLTWILEADIINFFGEVDIELLFEKLFPVIRKPSLRDLIRAAVVNEIGNRDEIKEKDKSSFPQAGIGIPQGAILSPMLANFYLSSFDKVVEKHGFRMIRYADDFVIMCDSKEEAERAYEVTEKYLRDELKLTIHQLGTEKTRIIEYQHGFTFLGYDIRQGKHYPSRQSIKKQLEKIDKAFEHPRGKALLPVVTKVASSLASWKEPYKDSDISEAAATLNSHVAKHVTAFLRINAFTHDGRTVTQKQLSILGIPSI
jgi:RNA-directed DNA polymerase